MSPRPKFSLVSYLGALALAFLVVASALSNTPIGIPASILCFGLPIGGLVFWTIGHSRSPMESAWALQGLCAMMAGTGIVITRHDLIFTAQILQWFAGASTFLSPVSFVVFMRSVERRNSDAFAVVAIFLSTAYLWLMMLLIVQR